MIRRFGWVGFGMTLLCVLACGVEAATYYISPDGCNTNNGTSRTTPWRSLSKGQPFMLETTGASIPGGTYQTNWIQTEYFTRGTGFAPTGQLRIADEIINYSTILTNQSGDTPRYCNVFTNLYNEGTGGNVVTGAYGVGTLVYDNLILGGDSFDPGDVIMVTTGEYNRAAELFASGSPGNPITYRADGEVVIDPNYDRGADGFRMYPLSGYITDVTIDGSGGPFLIDNAYDTGINLRYAHRINIGFCVLYGQTGSESIYVGSDCGEIVVSNCTTWICDEGVRVAGNSGVTFRNCIMVGSGFGGLVLSGVSSPASSNVVVENCCIWGNATGNIHCYSNGLKVIYDTNEEVSGATQFNTASFANNVSLNPGFSDLANSWNFNGFYENSPCLNSAQGVDHMGAYQNPTIVPVSSETWFVKTDGDDNASGLDWDNAWATISTSASSSGPGDTVIVEAGTYNEAVTINTGGSADEGVLYQAQGGVLVSNAAPFRLYRVGDVTLDGFSVWSTSSDAIYVSESVMNTFTNLDVEAGTRSGFYLSTCIRNTIAKCSIHGETGTGADTNPGDGGILNTPAYGPAGNFIRDCAVFDNDSDGMRLLGEYNRVERCIAYNNGRNGIASAFTGSGFLAYNCVAYSNALDGIGAAQNGGFTAVNCTSFKNAEGGFGNVTYKDSYVYNCIASDNTEYGLKERDTGNDEIFSEYCLFWNNGTANMLDEGATDLTTATDMSNAVPAGSVNNVFIGDPDFVSATRPDLRLRTGSPAVDVGDTSALTGLSVYWIFKFPLANLDKDGKVRVKFAGLDLGAYELQPSMGTLFMIR